MRSSIILCGILSLSGCQNAQRTKAPISCPDPALVAPASIGGAAALKQLTGRLAGGDWQNAVDEAASRFRIQDPKITTDMIVDVIIAADCPNSLSGATADDQVERARVTAIRQRVMQILGP